MSTPQYFEPGGGLDDEFAKSKKDELAEAEPRFEESLDNMAEKIQSGLRFGPLDFQLGLSNGWEYSSQNSFGGGTDFNNSNSFFSAPTLGILYERRSVSGMSRPAIGPAIAIITTPNTRLLEPTTRETLSR